MLPNFAGGSLEAVLDRVARCGAAGVHVELPVDRAEVRVDSAQADDELLRDLGVGAALGDQRQHLELPGRQAFRRIGVGSTACRRHELNRRAEREAPAVLPGGLEASIPQGTARLGEDVVVARAKPGHERYADRPEDGSGGAEEADGPLGVTGRGGQEGRRLEHQLGEPAIAELDEERQRLLELCRRRLGVAEIGADVGDVPEHLAEDRRSPTVRRMSRLSVACARAVTSAPAGRATARP